MSKNLLIVESPAKAKTIEKILGKDFTVKSSYGHVRDLAKKDMGIDIDNKYTPKYIISKDKSKVVKELKQLAKNAEVWLATDEDREGEAISWHLLKVLGLKDDTKRIVFHEITPDAIKKAVQSPRTIDINLVNAQQARRVLDRLVGFELSPLLWKKISSGSNLSAGRVQSVAVKLLVEREREIIHFEPQEYYKVSAQFLVDGVALDADLSKRFDNEEDAAEFLNACIESSFKIGDVQVKPGKRTPAAPFTTSTLQQEASRKLGFSVARTMSVAQRLYENGLITYMRTDSVNLSKSAIGKAKQVITEEFGENYSKIRTYKSKSKGAQEAHEAIRPTYIENRTVDVARDEQRLYDLIWKRTVASQMADAKLERTTIKIDVSKRKEQFTAKGEVIQFDGFLKLYIESKDDEDNSEDKATEGLLPKVTVGQEIERKVITATQRFTNSPFRFTEASLVKQLEELGIGRPSTYAPTIQTIQNRGYVVKETRDGDTRTINKLTVSNGSIEKEKLEETYNNERNKLFPTNLGMVVTDFLEKHFERIMDYSFTANIENEFDQIAEGKQEWVDLVDNIYKPFHETVEDTEENAEREAGERILGEDPKTGRTILVRIGRYGPMAQIGLPEDDQPPRYTSLLPNQHLETITLEEALTLFKLPRELGEMKGQQLKANIGRFGPYVQLGRVFASIPKDSDLDPYTITFDDAKVLMEEKLEAEAKKHINTFETEDGEIFVLNGRWGPYIKKGKTNYKIPKDVEAEKLSLQEVLEIIEKAPAKKRGGRKSSAKAKKSTTKKKSTKKTTKKK